MFSEFIIPIGVYVIYIYQYTYRGICLSIYFIEKYYHFLKLWHKKRTLTVSPPGNHMDSFYISLLYLSVIFVPLFHICKTLYRLSEFFDGFVGVAVLDSVFNAMFYMPFKHDLPRLV